MTIRARLSVILDLTLASALVWLSVTHVHLTVRTHRGSAVVPAHWLHAVILLAMAAVTAWSLLGRRSR
jgi:hypothetical protein